MLKLSEIVILWVYYTISFGSSLIWHFWGITSTFKLLCLAYFTDECSVPEMRILSILFIKSDLKCCIHLSRSLFSYLWWAAGKDGILLLRNGKLLKLFHFYVNGIVKLPPPPTQSIDMSKSNNDAEVCYLGKKENRCCLSCLLLLR